MRETEHLYFGNSRKRVTRAILHCAAVPTGWQEGKSVHQMATEIEGWHKSRGFKGIGYHYVVDQNGFIAVGRPLNTMGAHTLGENHDTLGILMVERNQIRALGKFEDFFTEKQRIAVGEILRYHAIKEWHGHNEYAPKLCPGFRAQDLPRNFFDRDEQVSFWQRIGALLFPKNLTQE